MGYLQEVSRRLSREYGDPRLNNKDDPLDELIFIILSAKTTESSYLRTYNALECAFPGWFGILSARPSRVRELIAGGVEQTKAITKLADSIGKLLDRLTPKPEPAGPAPKPPATDIYG